jgi:PPM family protein phosphatase
MIEIGSALDPGRKRIATPNQDALCVIRPGLLNWHPPLLVLADGMGGYEGGSEASQLVIRSFTETYQRSKIETDPLHILEEGVSAALRALNHQASQQPNLSRMGSTVVAAVLKGHSIFLLNVGDSRAYLFNSSRIRQVSYDHSLVGDQLRQGLITEAQVRVHPRRNVLCMSLNAQRQQVETYTAVIDWKPGDSLVLCSDGLWGPVNETEIQSIVLQFSPQQAAEKLVQLANANLGPDNISVIVAKYI